MTNLITLLCFVAVLPWGSERTEADSPRLSDPPVVDIQCLTVATHNSYCVELRRTL